MLHSQISNDVIHRSHMIAEYMYENASKYYLNSTEMFLLGLTHCIGLLQGDYSFESKGSNILFNMSYALSDIVKDQNLTPKQYLTLHQCTDADIPKELILLWEANMHIDDNGYNVGYVTRLADLEEKLGAASAAYNAYRETILWLEAYNSRIDLLRSEHIIFPKIPINVAQWLSEPQNKHYACIGELDSKDVICYCTSDDADVLTGISMVYDQDYCDGNHFWCGPTLFSNETSKNFREPRSYSAYNPNSDELLNRVIIE